MDFNKIIVEQLNELKFDCLVREAYENGGVLTEASIYARGVIAVTNAIKNSKLPNSIKLKLLKNPSRTFNTLGMLTTVGAIKVSSIVQKLYIKARHPKCGKLRNKQARKECILQMKIMGKMKAIEYLKRMRQPGNKEKINKQIKKLEIQIHDLKSKSLNLGIEF